MTKTVRLVVIPVVRKEKAGCNLECGDDDNTPSLADDELVNEALKQMHQLGKEDKCDVCCDNHIEQMTITHEKKDEVCLMSGPSWSVFVSLEDSAFDKLNHMVKLSWKQQTKGMNRIFGPCVRDKFMKDLKSCNEEICRHIITTSVARNEALLIPSQSDDQFVDAALRSAIVSKLLDSQQVRNLTAIRQSIALNDLLAIVHQQLLTCLPVRTQGGGRSGPQVVSRGAEDKHNAQVRNFKLLDSHLLSMIW